MSDFIYQDLDIQERVKMLLNMSTKRQQETYNRSLSEQEIDAEKDRYAKDAIELARQEDELKTMVDNRKSAIKSLQTLMVERLEKIKTGQMEIHGMIYGIPNQAKGRMNFYDKYGELVSSRSLTADERQGRLFIGNEGEDIAGEEGERPDDGDPGQGIMDVEYEETDEQSVTEVEVKEPEEDKPKKKGGRKKKENPDDLPI